ncbi:MAG: GH3 auxin-responsive promoter family protein [Elainella sp.]
MRWLIQQFAQLLQPAAQRFERALDQPDLAQQQIQQQICQRLTASRYGQFLGINSIADWQRVPIVTYDDIQPWIRPDQLGKASLLTPEPILFYEQTSGSQGPAKWIPYTGSLRRSFNQMFCVWAYDLIRQGPVFSTGKLYFCITPRFQGSTASTRPGLNDDSEYLDEWLRLLLSPFLVSPAGLHAGLSPQEFKHRLCIALLQAERLEIISIWSPSFLKILLDYILTHRVTLSQQVKLSPVRRRLLTDPDLELAWPQLWPHLKLISCWDNLYAADQAQGLRQRFPGVLVQGKGLLATEAPMTIPLIAGQGTLPVLDQVFFEFEDEQGQIHRLHELTTGHTYQIILSQLGGLYRYRIGDRVRVSRFYRQTPCLEFLGRSRATSDLVGEKLHESFVQQVLQKLHLGACFSLLLPVVEPARYLLLLDRTDPAADPDSLASRLDQALGASPHYRQARHLGQLHPPQVFIAADWTERWLQFRLRAGQRWGDQKLAVLAQPITQADWQRLAGPDWRPDA